MAAKQYSLAQLNAIYCVYKDLNPDTHVATCVTCGKSIYISDVEQCFELYGHYIPRSLEPKLKYHPDNSHCQCKDCNLNETAEVREAYEQYVCYRYGKNKHQQLKQSSSISDSEWLKFYIEKLTKLSDTFPELIDVIIANGNNDNVNNGKIIATTTSVNNDIAEQFRTYSKTYRQDLDDLSKALQANFIEYERL